MLLPRRFFKWKSVVAPSTLSLPAPPPPPAVCSPPVQTDPTSTARFEAASATSASGGPDETPLHEWALQNSGQKNKRHWAGSLRGGWLPPLSRANAVVGRLTIGRSRTPCRTKRGKIKDMGSS